MGQVYPALCGWRHRSNTNKRHRAHRILKNGGSKMIQANYVGEGPNIDIENSKLVVNNIITITISEFEISLDEADAKELLDGLEETLIPWDDTRSGLEKKIEDMTEELENLRERVAEYEKECGK
jgi:uncharacterized protein (DUF2164 family)